ncbi:hypothetical protein D3C84_976800 [compost metagenome]
MAQQRHRLQQARAVGGEEADEADGAGQGDGTGGQQGGGEQYADPHPGGGDAQGAGLAVAHLHQRQLPAEQGGEHQAEQRQRADRDYGG